MYLLNSRLFVLAANKTICVFLVQQSYKLFYSEEGALIYFT